MKHASKLKLRTEATTRLPILWASSLFGLVGLALLLPPTSLFNDGTSGLLASHLALEMFGIVVALLVVIGAYHSLDEIRHPIINSLILMFTAVAGIDFVHAISYEGMPPFISPSSMPKAVFFWLMGRAVELLGFALILRSVKLPGSRLFWLLGGFAITGLTILLWESGASYLPVLFVKGLGVTSTKAVFDGLLAIGYFFVATLFWRTADNENRLKYRRLAKACFIMGIGELTLVNYTSPGEWQAALGHVYKVMAYAYVLHAIFLTTLKYPYERLKISQQHLMQKEAEYHSLIENLPVGILRLDTNLHIRLVNDLLEKSLGRSIASMTGQPISEVLPNRVLEILSPVFQRVLAGERLEAPYDYVSPTLGQVYRHFIGAPEYSPEGQLQGVLGIILDTTDRNLAQMQLQAITQEAEELRTAIDAHAIVAITDRRGVILHVNNKFCDISQYSREELIGNTHRLINSGHHSKSFFKEMWGTIGRGKVWSGELCNRAKDGSLYWVQSTIVPLLDANHRPDRYIAIRADITQRKLAEQEVERLAFYDVVTGLPNRRMMNSRLEQIISRTDYPPVYSALILLDLDHFKDINDTLGHLQGDELLRKVGVRLSENIRENDTVARLGGDEFVVLLNQLGTSQHQALLTAADLGERLREALAQPYQLTNEQVISSASMGAVLIASDATHSVDELVRWADLALYKAKEEGRNNLRFFNPGFQIEINERTHMLRDLRSALERNEFRVFYQPIVDVDRTIVGVEALLRWIHPEKGMVSPATFIPLCEQSGLIHALGKWVLETACEQLHHWENDPQRSTWTISVNISARQLHESDFIDTVKAALARSRANPERLKLELTENLLLADIDDSVVKIQALEPLGVQFSLDDFGTGYSSLSYLKRLPLDQCKIDASFVRDIMTDSDSAAIVRMILALAATLNLDVVAEGVETEEQFELLRSYGCQHFQGYLFGKPQPLD